mmetsp:Transcript_37940/g.108362  ORF Transcript_37940/g.108362 Transcript_37940/m.108362 type:complete len:107 (+) Transcript_37940:1292-1612(+)
MHAWMHRLTDRQTPMCNTISVEFLSVVSVAGLTAKRSVTAGMQPLIDSTHGRIGLPFVGFEPILQAVLNAPSDGRLESLLSTEGGPNNGLSTSHHLALTQQSAARD